MIRRPPRSTLFPYTSSSDLLDPSRNILRAATATRSTPNNPKQSRVARSEEHTSELQSRSDLVCRLLLEKKKTTQQQTPDYPADDRSVHDRRYHSVQDTQNCG